MAQFLQQIANGLSVGGIYALAAIGITLIFGLTGIVNFAHGQVLMLGGYVAYASIQAGLDFFSALLIAAAAMALTGALLERGVFKWTLKTPITGFIVSVGIIPVMEVFAVEVWNTDPRSAFPPFGSIWTVADVRISAQRVFVLLFTLAMIAVLFYVLRFTHLGRALRAAAEDRDMAALTGLNVGRLITGTFVIGSCLAGIGGALLLSLFPITPYIGGSFIFKAFAISLVGGLGNVAGAIVVALIIGVGEALATGYLSSQWADAYVLAIMLAFLFVRPMGLFRGTEGGSVV